MAVYTTASHSWAVGETVTAANMNGQLRDFINGFGAWTAYTPVWTAATTNPVIGNGTISGTYMQVGKMVLWTASLVMGSTTTFGSGVYSFSVPVTMQTVGDGAPLGGASLVQSSTGNRYLAEAVYTGTTTKVSLLTQAAAGASGQVSNTVPFTWASGDKIAIGGSYQST